MRTSVLHITRGLAILKVRFPQRSNRSAALKSEAVRRKSVPEPGSLQDNAEVTTQTLPAGCLSLDPGVPSDLWDYAELSNLRLYLLIRKIDRAAPASQDSCQDSKQ